MNKKDYIDAMNEVEVDEKMKNETIQKVQEQPSQKKKYNIIYPLASVAVICIMLVAILVPKTTLAPTKVEIPEEKTVEQVQQEGALPKVENFENLYAMLKERTGNSYYVSRYMTNGAITDDLAISAESVKSTAAAEQSSSGDYSKTNVQVEGVDEADIAKTDGKYIYYLTNSKLTITDISNSNLVLSTKMNFYNEDFSPQEIYVKDNKLVILGNTYRETNKKRNYDDDDYYYYYKNNEEYATAKIYDIVDRTNIREDRTVEIEGYYMDSRMIGDNLYLISNEYNYYAWICSEKEINELDEEDFKPKYRDTVISEDTMCLGFNRICYFPEFEETSYLNIAAVNIKNNEKADIESYLGAGSDIYVSTDNLYVIKETYRDSMLSYDGYRIKTEIYKFALKNDNCEFVATGTVSGSVLNQFSMDEKDGYFRIATTKSRMLDGESVNNLYVLNEKLETVGELEGLAEGERIYSVRFMGNRAYMVTFVETDPLFVIDLSDPTNPTVLGELKIPGYSKYLHPYDETHIIGFGEDTELLDYGYGNVVRTTGMKMALFDVTDPTNPKEMYTQKIGDKGTHSELLYNHKALLFSKEKNIIAFPISVTGEDYRVTFKGAIVYGLSLDKGFELKGKISNAETEYDNYYYRNDVERILYVGNTLYTLSRSLIKATDMNTMKTTGSLEIDKSVTPTPSIYYDIAE